MIPLNSPFNTWSAAMKEIVNCDHTYRVVTNAHHVDDFVMYQCYKCNFVYTKTISELIDIDKFLS